jgi:hypothetical protein
MSDPVSIFSPRQRRSRAAVMVRTVEPAAQPQPVPDRIVLGPPRLASVPAPPPEKSIEDRLIAILESPPHAHEMIAAGFARKEAELGNVLATVELDVARALHKRLTTVTADDRLVAAFNRLTADRRQRLIVYLADARRRAAISTARR